MKIVILSDYFDDRGGAVGIAKAAAFGLKSFGHDVSVITTIQNKSLAGKRNENGIAVYPIYSNYNLFIDYHLQKKQTCIFWYFVIHC